MLLKMSTIAVMVGVDSSTSVVKFMAVLRSSLKNIGSELLFTFYEG